ncbi:DUF7857 domain-containing protein [Halorhabdus tiamatea]|nr:hypothetical protein [Halorhabdus tiamatea]CCQ32355.1 conserved hypothetical protein [Halorhabdus tiamatea SARL4B]
MVELDTETIVEGGVTFVQATVTNTRGTSQAVRLENRLEGPPWPPRRAGIETPEWDGDYWEGTVQPGERRGLGYASPAEPIDQPLTVVDVRRVTSADRRDTSAVLRDLDGWRPPRALLADRR